MKKTDKTKETVLIGKVGSPVGIKGEVRITLYAQDSTNLKEGKVLLLERAGKTIDAAIKLNNSGMIISNELNLTFLLFHLLLIYIHLDLDSNYLNYILNVYYF